MNLHSTRWTQMSDQWAGESLMRQGGADDIPDDDGLRDDGCRRRRPDRRPDCPAGCGHARHQSGKDQTVATGRRVSRGVEADRHSASAVADSEIIRDRLEKPRPLVAYAVDHAPAIRRSLQRAPARAIPPLSSDRADIFRHSRPAALEGTAVSNNPRMAPALIDALRLTRSWRARPG